MELEAMIDQNIKQRLRMAQAWAGMAFSVFLVLHLSNFYLAPFGIEAFNGFQRVVRLFYQFPLVELLVVALPLITHLICGIWLLLIRKKETGRFSGTWHTWAGLFLTLVIFGHVAAVRGPSLFFDVYPEFEGLSFSLWYFPAYFYPYYFLLAMAGFYHGMLGFGRAGSRLGYAVPRRVPASLLTCIGIWSGISLIALGGGFFEVPSPMESDFAKLGQQLFDLDTTKPFF